MKPIVTFAENIQLPADQVLAAELGYTGKGYGHIYIEVEPKQMSGSLVKISFINELTTMN